MNKKNPELQRGIRVLYGIWSTMLFSVLIYLLVAWWLANKGLVTPVLQDTSLLYTRVALYILAPCTILLAVALKRGILLKKNTQKGEQEATGQTQVALDVAWQKYTLTMIFVWGLTEFVGVYGLVLFLLGGNTIDLHVLMCVSIAALCVLRPKQWEILYVAKTAARKIAPTDG